MANYLRTLRPDEDEEQQMRPFIPSPSTNDPTTKLGLTLQNAGGSLLRPVVAPPGPEPTPVSLPPIGSKIGLATPQNGGQSNASTSAMAAPAVAGLDTPVPTPFYRPIGPISMRSTQDQNRIDDFRTKGSGVDQFAKNHKYLGIAARVGDVLGTVLAPRVAAAIPGTTLHHDQLLEQQEQYQARDLAAEKAQADTEESQARAAALPIQAQADADKAKAALEGPPKTDFELWAKQNPNAPVSDWVKLQEQKNGDATPFKDWRKNNPNAPLSQFFDLQQQSKPDTTAQADAQYRDIEKRLALGQPVSEEDKAAARAYEHQKTLGPVASSSAADVRQLRQQNFQNTRDARKEIQDAEKTYRQAKDAGDALNGFIELAQSGNKEAAATVPLEGTLRIVTSQGVKRINRTEVEGIEGAGSLFDQIQGKIGKLKEGQPIPPDLLNDMAALNRMLTHNAYHQYSDHYDQARDLYEPAGVDFGKIRKLSGPDDVTKLPDGVPSGATHVYRDPNTHQVVGYALGGQYHALKGVQ